MAKTKQKVPKAVQIVEVKNTDESPEFLHPSHLLTLEVSQRDIENAKLKMALEEQALRNMILESQLLSIKIEKQKQVLHSLSKSYEAEKEKFTSSKKDIWPQYGLDIEAGLGYDSVSGKIVK